MKIDQWELLNRCGRMEESQVPPISLIVDSPWIPGYLGISTLDYFTMPNIWLDANLQIIQQFPDIIFMPGFWVEIGMAAEPSGFGCRVSFYDDKTPAVHHCLSSVGEVDRLTHPNPNKDGLMPLILNYYKKLEPKINDTGHQIKIVAARGPLATATHLMGVTNFLLGLKLDPQNTHKVIKITTEITRNWLEAQANVLKEVEGILILDDIVGFLSPDDYLEFAHPYLKEIFEAFPDALKIFHNDMNNPASYPYLSELPINIFNFTHLQTIDKVRQLVGKKVCLMGNIPPLDVLAQANPNKVIESVKSCLDAHPGKEGFILSAGGGVSPGTPKENVEALVISLKQYSKGGKL